MAARKKRVGRKSAEAMAQSQLRDAKGVNAVRDAKRSKRGAVVATTSKGAGTANFRKGRRAPE
jgi:hypothetical protein